MLKLLPQLPTNFSLSLSLSLSISLVLCVSLSACHQAVENQIDPKTLGQELEQKPDPSDQTTLIDRSAKCDLQLRKAKIDTINHVQTVSAQLTRGDDMEFTDLEDGIYTLETISTEYVLPIENYHIISQITIGKDGRVAPAQVLASIKRAPEKTPRDLLHQIPIELEFQVSKNKFNDGTTVPITLNATVDLNQSAVANCFSDHTSDIPGAVQELAHIASQDISLRKTSTLIGAHTRLRLIRADDNTITVSAESTSTQEKFTIIRRLVLSYHLTREPLKQCSRLKGICCDCQDRDNQTKQRDRDKPSRSSTDSAVVGS